jgi:hypothetical protein
MLRIILIKPPPGIDFGLQKGAGINYQTLQIQRSGSDDLYFDFIVGVKGDEQRNPLPQLGGPFVQGPALGKFTYIDIGTYAGHQSSLWGRRLKIPLTGITWDVIKQVISTPGGLLETLVPGTGRYGGPNCATVKPFDGWKIKTPSA